MNISAIYAFNNYRYNPAFKENKSENQQENQADKNPISRFGETANLIKATFIGGLLLGAKCLAHLVEDGDFVIDEIAKKAGELVDKNKADVSRNKKILYKFGAFASLFAAALTGFALLYTAYKAPKIAYESKINTYTKSKEMDVYIKANKAEKEIYQQLSDKAKTSTQEEKKELSDQYLKMRIAKNQVPWFVNQKK